jgi:hypothetical protein
MEKISENPPSVLVKIRNLGLCKKWAYFCGCNTLASARVGAYFVADRKLNPKCPSSLCLKATFLCTLWTINGCYVFQ